MVDLEQRLRDLGPAIAYPPTPNLATLVGDSLRANPRTVKTGRQTWVPMRLVLAAAVALLLATGALAAIPASRNAVAGWLGIRGILIQAVPSLPPTPTSTATPRTLAERLNLGHLTTLGQAQAAVPYHILVPARPGPPDQVYLMEPADRKAVALVYLPRPDLPEEAHSGVGLLLIEFPGRIGSDFFGKMLGPDARLTQVQVNGHPGYWISGSPHGFVFVDPSGAFQDDTFRLAGNTLLWEQGALTVRIESGLSESEALGVVASLR